MSDGNPKLSDVSKENLPNPVDKVNLKHYFSTHTAEEDPFDTVFSDQPESNEKQYDIQLEQRPATTTLPATNILLLPRAPQLDVTTMHRLQQQDAWLPAKDRDHLVSGTKADDFAQPRLTPAGQDDASELDPYRTALLKHLNDELAVNMLRRVPVVSDALDQQIVESQLKDLITNGWYNVALQVTHRFLANEGFTDSNAGGGHLTPFTAQVWLTRLALLVRIRRFETAEQELSTFPPLDDHRLFYQSAPDLYPGRKGSLLPFSFRLLHAELPFQLGQVQTALDRLYHMLVVIRRIQSNLRKGLFEDGSSPVPDDSYQRASLSLWICREVRVLSSCLSIYLAELDYEAAVETVHQLAIVCSHKQSIIRGLAGILGRIYLQMGDLETAKDYFSRAVHTTEHERQPQLLVQTTFQDALLAIGRNEYEEANNLFQRVLNIDPTNVAAANNLAVCFLYLGQLSSSIRVLDVLTTSGLSADQHPVPQQQQHPLAPALTAPSQPTVDDLRLAAVVPPRRHRRRFCLHDALVFNLAVLYEVESDTAIAKKLRLLERLAGLSGEPVNLASFKLPLQALTE